MRPVTGREFRRVKARISCLLISTLHSVSLLCNAVIPRIYRQSSPRDRASVSYHDRRTQEDRTLFYTIPAVIPSGRHACPSEAAECRYPHRHKRWRHDQGTGVSGRGWGRQCALQVRAINLVRVSNLDLLPVSRYGTSHRARVFLLKRKRSLAYTLSRPHDDRGDALSGYTRACFTCALEDFFAQLISSKSQLNRRGFCLVTHEHGGATEYNAASTCML